jgi:membrane-bound PQQ-dependent dehydrogenase (glucose/quinate/shikimate family)
MNDQEPSPGQAAHSSLRPPRVFAGLLLLMGGALAVGGARLAMLGGSWYFLPAGLLLLLSAVLLWRGDRRGSWVYGALYAVTLTWSLIEVGFDPWALLPRLGLLSVLGLWLLAPRTRRALHRDTPLQPLWRQRSTQAAATLIAGLAVVGIVRLQGTAAASGTRPTAAAPGGASDASGEWQHFGRTQAGTRYAPFTQIDASNVQRLKVAWTYRTGVNGDFKATPLQIGDSLYFCTGGNVMIALDASSGTERWRFDPKVNTRTIGFTRSCRGLTYYRAPDAAGAQCEHRLLTATTDARMFAVDAKTGERCADFGAHENTPGEITLLTGMGEVQPGYYYVTSPPTIARNVAVLGGWVLDNRQTEAPSGVVRGFDPITGKLQWAWDAGRPGGHVPLAAGEQFTRGTPNAWSVFSADDELGLVFVPTGNATPDYFGGHRSEFSEQYASSVVALDVTNGDVRWSFQTTHHDLWDYDVPSQPVLTQVPDDQGVSTPAVIVPTKRGELFVLDRRSGVPITAVAEKPVPQTDVPQEWTAKTQPFSVGMPSFAGSPITEADTWGLTPIDNMMCRIRLKTLRYEGPLTPPSLKGSIQYPGFAGGMNWGSVAVHEPQQLMVVQSLHIANHVRLVPRAEVTDGTSMGYGGGLQLGTPYLAYTMPWLSGMLVPCQRPPYGEMAVVDLRTRKTVWQRPVGTAKEMGPAGLLKLKIPLPMGMFFIGGTVVTDSGLIFVGGIMDGYLRALDLYSGRELWRAPLPRVAHATPMTYLGADQRQYVVITVPGAPDVAASHTAALSSGTDLRAGGGGHVIAYALD